VNYVTRNHEANYPFTRVEDIVEFVGAGDYIFNVIDDFPAGKTRPPNLWHIAECGVATDAYQKRLESKGVKTVPESMMNDSEYDLIEWGINPDIAFQGSSPFDFSRLVLTEVQALAVNTHSLPAIVVIGEKLTDFCLYYTLSKMHGKTIWLPNWFMPVAEEFPKYMGSAIRKLEDKAQKSGNTSFALMSTSLPHQKLHDLIATLRTQITTISFAVEDGNDSFFIERQLRYPRKRYISQNVERVTTHQLVDDRLPGAFESPVPSAFLKVDPSIHRYVTEINFANHETPRHPSLSRQLIYGPRLGDVRAGIDGATYSNPGSFVTSSDIELQILRPGVYVPGAEDIFRIALEDCGFEHVISDKGAYETQTPTKFEGLSEIAKALSDEKQLALLRKFKDTSTAKDKVYDEGTFIEKLERRFLDFASILKILGDLEITKETIDRYILKGIFYRGLILQCNRCADLEWFDITEISQKFTCRRCGTTQNYTAQSGRHPHEPSWFYKLDEIVYQMIAHNGEVTLMSLHALERRSVGSFLFAPELGIKEKGSKKPFMEIDICCVMDGQLMIGEAKSVDTLKTSETAAAKAASKYKDIALQLGCSGVVFSTTAPNWNEETLQAIAAAFSSHPQIRVIKLTASTL
jgi:hypothetical protein